MKKIYFNGDFITLEADNAEAILIEDRIIKKVGSKEEILSMQDEQTELVNLKGKTMMPAFIDAHSHFFAVANNFLQASLDGCKSFKEILEKLLKYKKENNIEEGKWILANGYDHNILKENKHITKLELDEVLPNNPVVIQHKSGHNGVFNSLGLKLLEITNKTEAPVGGVIEKKNGELTGYLEENAFIEDIKKVPMPEIEELIKSAKKAEKEYASYGITTAQEGMMTKELVPIYKKLVSDNLLDLDIIAFIDTKAMQKIKETFPNNIKKYENNFKIGGIKIFLDGSPQARTAWMRTSYIDDENYFGYGTMQNDEVENAIKEACREDLQILAHCNGDRAAEQYINSISKEGDKVKNIRPVLIHGQLLGVDQLKEVKELGIIPSFFIAHTYYWGDVHIKNFGLDRASKISPAGSAKKNGIKFTFHQDSPVIEPNMFETIWCAVNRTTNLGEILEEDERLNVIDAIKAVTINSSYQYFEENVKGSIKEGKLANLIIVDKNPLKIDKEEIRNIQVLETIREGRTIYKRSSKVEKFNSFPTSFAH